MFTVLVTDRDIAHTLNGKLKWSIDFQVNFFRGFYVSLETYELFEFDFFPEKNHTQFITIVKLVVTDLYSSYVIPSPGDPM